MQPSLWTWSVGGGSVTLDVGADGVETVKLGPRLISRSPPGGKPEGHAFRLPPLPTGVEGAAIEVRFDRHRSDAVLRADGREIPPSSVTATSATAANVAAVPKSLLGERLGGAFLCFLIAGGLTLYIQRVLASAIAGKPYFSFSMKLVFLCPGLAVMGLGLLFAPRSVFEATARARATGKLEGAGLVFALVVGLFAISAGLAAHLALTVYLENRGYQVR